MSKYTTGEIAKLCDVSVRTVQYYDARNILVPSELSEGGRRLYSEDDLKRMRMICFLREAGFPLSSISELLGSDHPESIISLLPDRQELQMRDEVEERQKKLRMIENIRRELKTVEKFSVESIGDIAHKMKNKNELRRMQLLMVLTGLPVTALQWVSIILWIKMDIWWPFILWLCAGIPYGILISIHYFKHTAYICPDCHEVFRPGFKAVFWAKHTPRMRFLICPKCGRRGYCLEVYADKDGENHA